MIVISSEDQKKLLAMEEAIDAVGKALQAYSDGNANTPIRTALSLKSGAGTALFMPSLVEAESSLGIKFVSVFPQNKRFGKETIYGVMVLADVVTGESLALLEASHLTVQRTGAAAGLATKYLARTDASVLSVIGTGRQARGLIEAVMATRPITTIYLYNRNQEKAEQFASELIRSTDRVEVIVVDSAKEATIHADVLVTATNSSHPVIDEEWVKPGTHINAIGSFRPKMQEIPTGLIVNASKLVVESREAALKETGDLVVPIKAGVFGPEVIYAEMGELVARRKIGREDDREITIFKSVGLAAMDVVVAKEIYDRARNAGIGQKVSLY